MRRWLGVWGVLLSQVSAAQAPGALLRFHPAIGSLMRTQTDIEVSTTYVGLPAVPDSETATASLRVMVSRRPLSQQAPGLWSVQVTLDSARGTSRFSNAGRKDIPLPFDGTVLGVGVDSAMGPVPVNAPPAVDTAAKAFARATALAFMLPLPRGPVAAGTSWTCEHAVPLADLMPIGVPGAVAGPRTLTAHVVAKVDSLVPRGTDTLAYVSYTAQLEPAPFVSRDTSGVTTTTVTGAVAASQIWSTAWSGWVSGGMRSRVEFRMHSGSTDAAISADITARMQVRP